MDQTLEQKEHCDTLFMTLAIQLEKLLNKEKCKGSDNILPDSQ